MSIPFCLSDAAMPRRIFSRTSQRRRRRRRSRCRNRATLSSKKQSQYGDLMMAIRGLVFTRAHRANDFAILESWRSSWGEMGGEYGAPLLRQLLRYGTVLQLCTCMCSLLSALHASCYMLNFSMHFLLVYMVCVCWTHLILCATGDCRVGEEWWIYLYWFLFISLSPYSTKLTRSHWTISPLTCHSGIRAGWVTTHSWARSEFRSTRSTLMTLLQQPMSYASRWVKHWHLACLLIERVFIMLFWRNHVDIVVYKSQRGLHTSLYSLQSLLAGHTRSI